MWGMNLTNPIGALDTATDSDIPTSATTARKLTGELTEQLDALKEWAGDLTELIESVESLGDELVAADRGEHESAHADWLGAVGQLAYHLREAIAAPAAP
jgi:hypothetical protein